MELGRLRELYKDMRRQGLTRAQFQYRHNNVVFDVIFFIDDSPFQLLFGAIDHRCSFLVDVKQGFEIRPFIQPPTAFDALCKALNLRRDPDNPFKLINFFQEFNLHIPACATVQKALVLPVASQPINIESGDKQFFSHWKNNSDKSGKVTDANLTKTKEAFGKELMEFCQKKNISSCWSNTEKTK